MRTTAPVLPAFPTLPAFPSLPSLATLPTLATLPALAVLLALAALVAPPAVGGAAPAAAQMVVGRVMEEGSLRPLPGAFVVLLDSAGARRGGVLAGPDGRFVLRAREGRFRILAELIGYAGTTTPAVEVPATGAVRRNVVVPVQAVTLDGIQVEAGSRCRRGPRSGPATAALWEEARKALEVTRWGEAQKTLLFAITERQRDLDARDLAVLAQHESTRRGYTDRSPYASLPPDSLERAGYVVAAPGGAFDYYAPDAATLLSDAFLQGHCFRVQPPPAAEPDLVGLAFEPVPERTRPDISGVLWLDRLTARLQRLDFTYVGLPFPHGHWPQVGGRVEFDRLATGPWIVRRWRIRTPLAAGRTASGSRPELLLQSLREHGAVVRSVRTADGRTLAATLVPTLYGSLTAGPDGAPLADAVIEVVGTGRRARSADDGAFRFDELPAGRYRVRVAHPAIRAAGRLFEERTVDVRTRGVTRWSVRLADVDPAARPDGGRRGAEGLASGGLGSGGVLLGRVVDQTAGEPIAGVLVALRDSAGETAASVVTDANGRFRIARPDGGPDAYALRAEHIGYAAADGAVRLAVGEAVRVEVQLAARPIDLDPIVVRERRRGVLVDVGFYERREQGAGIFLDRERIERRAPVKVTDLLRGATKLRVVPMGLEEDVRVVGAGNRLTGDCQPAIWMDGTLVRRGGKPDTFTPPGGSMVLLDPTLTELVDPSAVAAMEVYTGAADLPPRFGGSQSDCGVVVIWTLGRPDAGG